MKTIDALKDEINNFLELKKIKKIVIISDNDEDGVTSAAQVKKFFNKNGVESKIIFYNHHTRLKSGAKKEFFNFGGEKVVFLDLADDFIKEVLEDLGDIGSALVLDHHSKRSFKESALLRIIKPNEYSKIEPSQYPTSKMSYDLFDGVDWLASIGIIGDSARVTWEAFITKTIITQKISIEQLDKMADIVSCIISQNDDKIESLLDFLVKTNDPRDLLCSEFAKLNDKFQKMLFEEVKRFDDEAENYPALNLSFFRTKYKFTSKLSNVISQKCPSRTIIILNHKDNKCNASIRSHNASVNELLDKEQLIDCARLAMDATKNIKGGKGGGHVPAAGASFPEESVSEFKNSVIEIITKKKK